jgi:hypothetical protein
MKAAFGLRASLATVRGSWKRIDRKGRSMMRFVIVDLNDDLGEGDVDKVLSAIRMTKGVKSADLTQDSRAMWGAYHRCRRVYAAAVSAAIDLAERELRGPDGSIIFPQRPTKYPDVQ